MLLKTYYTFKPLIPRRLQIQFRRHFVNRKLSLHSQDWPIDYNAGTPPEGWTGWPDGKKFALVLTHDVESAEGLNKCYLDDTDLVIPAGRYNRTDEGMENLFICRTDVHPLPSNGYSGKQYTFIAISLWQEGLFSRWTPVMGNF